MTDKKPQLLNVDHAVVQIRNDITPLPPEIVPLTDALNRVLARSITSTINLPPFANSSMDGYAVRAVDVTDASPTNPVRLNVVLDIPAGKAPDRVIGTSEAARIMTGAPMPEGATAVIPVEDTDTLWSPGDSTPLAPQVNVFRQVKDGDYIRPIGENVRVGQDVLEAGLVLRPQDIGMLAALGVGDVPVFRKPRVAVISTGDELVDVHEPLSPGKIRDSNSYVIAALLENHGADALRLPIVHDTLDDVRQTFRQALDAGVHMVISSAGVSVGTYDVVRTVLDELGSVNFWRVNVRPGKPLAYGQLGGVPFFGLPGNPVSAMVTFDIFVRPALLRMSGRPNTVPTITAKLSETISSDGRRSYIRVRLSQNDTGEWVATTTGTQSSGALMSMVLADGLLILPEGVRQAVEGESYTVRLLR